MSLMHMGRQGSGFRVLEGAGPAQFSGGCGFRTQLCVQHHCVERERGVVFGSGSSGRGWEVWRHPLCWGWDLSMERWGHRSPGYLSGSRFSGRISDSENILSLTDFLRVSEGTARCRLQR